MVGESTFFGLGGEIPSRSDFFWNTAVTEAHAAELLAECPPNAILVTPHGVADLQKNGLCDTGSEFASYSRRVDR